MLVLTRKLGEQIRIGDDIVITVLQIAGTRSARIGVDAPRAVEVIRMELADKTINVPATARRKDQDEHTCTQD